MKMLILITGTGRSGTSTMSGTLHHAGLSVPGPHFGANESNPKGFFESKWAVRFHKGLVRSAGVNDFDSRPTAFDRVQRAITPEQRSTLVSFLREQSANSDQVVIKDPRSVWVQGLWKEAAEAAGLEFRCISMLRHPAEVVGSRTTYYSNADDESARTRYETFNVARWVNNSVISERETRGVPRAFVRYTDLLDDWRQVLKGLGSDLGLHYNVDVSTDQPSAVDDFIDPALRRHRVTWDELNVPDALREVAQNVWEDLVKLGDSHGVDAAASTDLDEQSRSYRRQVDEAAAISHDVMEEVRADARRAGAAAARRRKNQSESGSSPRERPVSEVGTRELLGVVAGRVKQKVRRRSD